jgi:hypothetical protein
MSTTEGPIENRQLAAECRQLAAKLEAFPGPYTPPVEEQIALAHKEARRAKIMAAIALAIAFVALFLGLAS